MIRLKYIKEEKDKKCYDGNFISEKDVEQNLVKLMEVLRVFNISETVNIKLSKNKIKTGGKMFVSLNSCPSVYIILYKKILYGPQSGIAIQALNLLKSTKREFRATAIKIFARIISSLGYKYLKNTYKNASNEDDNTNG